jgi:hypothetical protein
MPPRRRRGDRRTGSWLLALVGVHSLIGLSC